MALLEGTVDAAGVDLDMPNSNATFKLVCKTTSAVRLLVEVPGLGKDYPIEIGESEIFRFGQVASVRIKGESGTATYKWCPVVVT